MLRNIFYYLLVVLFVNCEGVKSKQNNSAAIVLLLLQGGASCISSSVAPISNPGNVSSPTRTNYEVSGCSQNSLSSIGFSGENVSPGLTGTSNSSRISSNGNVLMGNDVNIEVTFILNSQNSYLDVVGRAYGSPSALSGPKVRFTNSTAQAFGTSGSSSNLGSGVLSTPVGQKTTYCIEFHEETDAHIILFPSSCSTVVSKGSPYSYDAEVSTTFPGRGLGFILNGVTLTNFKVGTKIASSGSIQE
ncbi:MAG: hypothetical protein L6Q54_04385 [Leptospiraceae bacterium]|nr:hypothetical protein [Leptospiraceae bacterium]MCK6380472.1 hypothetical protein [Leptospiraceae bacterium]NUM42206.1 hypothetical protein [Leptospiraceae bacterium]